ncbi:hypothetical protein KSF_020210 [Reticulibacter mediterranei]|uniref:Uncharacterized protein n=2 Tax=Reticulibacter mediterranei TaxID=2778369 RepID=A0A8J3N0X4_9CHLR|nr:hypothetical protein KSF_020210 [Reticulibacter mediterranei]
MDRLQRGEDSEGVSGLQLLSLAILHNDEQLWSALERCFTPVVRAWLRRHSRYEEACRVKAERRYVVLALAKFRQEVVAQAMVFPTLSAGLRYLLVCVNGVLLDTLRSVAWFEKIKRHELLISDDSIASMDPALLQQQLSTNEREQRLAYLLFYCGLTPHEIIDLCPSEFAHLQEIYQLLSSLLKQFHEYEK